MSDTPGAGIAIIGMACVFPGARDLRQYWENILRKVDAVSDAPAEWEADLFYDPESEANDRTYCKRGGFLGPLSQFDPTAHGVMPQSIDGTEPDHFLALRAAAEAMADAGYANNPKHRERTSVVIGRGTYVNRGNTTAIQHGVAVDALLRVLKQLHPEHSAEELAEIKRALKQSLPGFDAGTAAGLVPNIISGRIANRLDLMGPNYIVDAACASSLVAIDLAIQDLRSGRSDMAIAGGVHASTTPVILIIFSHLKALSRRGQIRPFDAGADGTLLGEGVGMVALKRLADAERDGDRVYAVIRGVGVASDGRGLGLLAPRLEGEVLALRRAYEDSAVEPGTVELIEAHGTATAVGDATELEALNSAFGPWKEGAPRCAIGSVKSMISHTMPAAGVAGLIKAALSLHHKVLPPTLHCENPNPRLGLDKSRFYLNTETRPWIHGAAASPRRAGVNAFGFGGINAHAVLEEYTGDNPAAGVQREWDSELLILSASSVPGLLGEVERVRAIAAAAGDGFHLRDLAWTLNCQRDFDPVRLAVVAASRTDLTAKLERAHARLSGSPATRIRDNEGIFYFPSPLARAGKVAVLFPGEGAQYVNMLADLCLHFPEVREWFDLMDAAFEKHGRGYRPSDAVFPPPGTSTGDRLFTMDVGAEAVFTANQALYALLEKLELRPDAVVGHSTGEHSALLAAGVVRPGSRDDVIRHVLGVNEVFERLKVSTGIGEGILLAVAGADHPKLESLVRRRDDLYFALDNCPHQVVLCGSEAAVDFVLRELAGTAAICQRLPMGRAYHTPLFTGFATALGRYLDTLPIHAPRMDLYSCVTTERYPAEPDRIRELAARQWASTVRFRETIEVLHKDGVRLFVECGPRGNLTGFVDDILRGRPYAALRANVQHRSGIGQMHHLLGMLVAHGVKLNLAHLYRRRDPSLFPPAGTRPKSREMPLSTGLQPLRLPESYVAASVAAPRVLAIPAAAASRPADSSGGPELIQQYLDTMNEFLASQQKVMTAYLGVRARPPGLVEPPAVPSRTGPFVTELVDVRAGERAVVRHRFSLDRERLFNDHTLGRQVSEFDRGLKGLPVVPITITMEIMAEAAALVLPGKVLTGMREIRSSRWIVIERDLTVELTAQREGNTGNVRVELRPAGADARTGSWAEGIMVFADSYPPPPSVPPFRLQNDRPSAWSAERLYVDGMFHGAAFQAVRRMDRSGADGTAAAMEVLPRDALFHSDPQPAFLTDPVILDAAGQVVAFWSQEVLAPKGDIFPFRLEALHCYQPPQPAGTRLECRVAVKDLTEREIVSDIEIVDSVGKLVYRLDGWWDRRFLTPPSFWDLRVSSGRTLIGKPWLAPVSGYGGTPGLACSLVDDLTTGLLESSFGIWANALAHIVLSRRERVQWDALRAASPKRRHEWLRGRCAAKDAVRLLVKERAGLELRAADVEIVPDGLGRPCVEGPWTGGIGRIAVSLAHHGEFAVALASLDPDVLIGIDLESIARSKEGFETGAFRGSERSMVDQLEPERRKEWLLRMWCAKEAVAKASGRGFIDGLLSLEITGVELESGRVHIELRDGAATALPALAAQGLVAHTSQTEGLVISTVVSQGAAQG